MKKFLIGIAVLSLVSITGVSFAKSWYEGGTLHNSKISQWVKATSVDRLATSADFVTVIAKNRGTIKLGEVTPKQFEDWLKPKATQLQSCISDAAKDKRLSSSPTKDVATVCALKLGY